ncbi:MAG: preprotein translocase subunit SecG [Candidatus Poribacteria bacterium]|nr:preprotein translocase subunit SecG [Candidatus Poribacteria bacterium]MDE0506931.1 preprotein translocase subunit SecG [Candidatus Poribacteria bacterium]
MEIIVGIVVVLFVPVCVLLTISILLQDSKGEGLSGSAFGASEMQSLLGGQGAATFLSKLTTYVAIAFMIIALFLMRFYGGGDSGTLTPLETETEQIEASAGGDEANIGESDEETSQTGEGEETSEESAGSTEEETAPSDQ